MVATRELDRAIRELVAFRELMVTRELLFAIVRAYHLSYTNAAVP